MAFQFFSLETRITQLIALKLFTKVVWHIFHLKVSTPSRFKVVVISLSGCRIRKFVRKKNGGTTNAKRCGSPINGICMYQTILVFKFADVVWCLLAPQNLDFVVVYAYSSTAYINLNLI